MVVQNSEFKNGLKLEFESRIVI